MIAKQFILGLLMSLAANAFAQSLPPVKTVDYVDLARYMGTWYEMASFPQFFARDCVASQAEYSFRDDGRVNVINSCRKNTFDGPIDKVEGYAEVVDTKTNAKLKVTFFWPISGDYWVIGLDADYQWAVVGHPSRDYLWILSRNRQMDETLYQNILDMVAAQGFDLRKLNKTPQP